MTDISLSSRANFQTRNKPNTDRNYKDILRATDTGHIPAHIDRGISGKNVSGHKITNPYILDHDDADLLDPGEESLSSDTEVVISRTSQNVHRLSIKPTSNEFTKKRDINSHHTATEVALASKPMLHNPRRPLLNKMSNQNTTVETLNAEIERYLIKLDALKTAKANLPETENSEDEGENNMYVQNQHRPKTMRKTTVLHDKDAFHPFYEPNKREQPTLYPRKSVEAVRLPPFETTTCVESYLAQFEICARYNGWTNEDKTVHLKLALKGAAAQILWDKGVETELTFDDLVRTLKLRFGSEGQSERYRMELISRKRGKNERIPTLHADILRLVTLAYPGQQGVINDIHAMNAFLSALDDKEFELRIRKKNPKDLEEAASMATRLEVYDKARMEAQNSRKVRSAVVKNESELELLLKKTQEENKKFQEELKRLREEVKKDLNRNKFNNSTNTQIPSNTPSRRPTAAEIRDSDRTHGQCFNSHQTGT